MLQGLVKGVTPAKATRPEPTGNEKDIFNKYSDKYISTHNTTLEQRKDISDIANCRTSAIGYNAKECNGCGDITFSYNSGYE